MFATKDIDILLGVLDDAEVSRDLSVIVNIGLEQCLNIIYSGLVAVLFMHRAEHFPHLMQSIAGISMHELPFSNVADDDCASVHVILLPVFHTFRVSCLVRAFYCSIHVALYFLGFEVLFKLAAPEGPVSQSIEGWIKPKDLSAFCIGKKTKQAVITA
jgi:hypothetical protein